MKKYPTVTLYTTPTCGLCTEAKLELQRLHLTYPHRLVEINIEADKTLFADYFLSIPVVKIGDVTLVAPITAVQLETALKNVTPP